MFHSIPFGLSFGSSEFSGAFVCLGGGASIDSQGGRGAVHRIMSVLNSWAKILLTTCMDLLLTIETSEVDMFT